MMVLLTFDHSFIKMSDMLLFLPQNHTTTLDMDILSGHWSLDQTHVVDEFSWEARMVMVSLTWLGCIVGILFGLILLQQTVKDKSCSAWASISN